jgi:glycerophosphoryl diester phosphodiesterase
MFRPLTLVAAGALAALTLVAPSGAAVASQAERADRSGRSSDVVDVAHRGSSGEAPENTLAAVELALAQHATFVEVDVQRTADGELVIMHDTTLRRTTDVEEVFPERAPWNVSDFTLEEIRQLDAGSWFSSTFAGEPVPTLREVVEVIGKRAGLLLELKSPALYPGIEAEIDKELRSVPGYLPGAVNAGKLVVQSFDHDSMRAYHDLAPEVPIGLLFGHRPSTAELDAAAGWVDQINPSHRVTDQALVDAVHQRDMTISVYTINDGRAMRDYIELGVDAIITNYPVVLRDIVRRD